MTAKAAIVRRRKAVPPVSRCASSPARIAVLRALQVGDMLCAVPALRALRAAHPAAEITLIGLPWAQSFARRFARYIDAFAAFPGYPGLPEQPADEAAGTRRIGRFFAWARGRRFDLALQLHGSGQVSNRVVARLGARRSAGFFPIGGRCPDRRCYLPYPDQAHEIKRCLRLTSFLGCEERGEQLEFPLHDADRREVAGLPEAARLVARPYVCIHAGARTATRRWPPERFAQVADTLAAQGLQIVLTGNGSEAALASRVGALMQRESINLARDISLGALAVVIAQARLLVANDTGVSHLAAALGTPSVILFMAADPARWAPLDTASHRALFHPVDCRPCSHASCPIGHPCAQALAGDQVIEAASALLAKPARSLR
jgi:ADP-heptose:LPS heptosyltransferase